MYLAAGTKLSAHHFHLVHDISSLEIRLHLQQKMTCVAVMSFVVGVHAVGEKCMLVGNKGSTVNEGDPMLTVGIFYNVAAFFKGADASDFFVICSPQRRKAENLFPGKPLAHQIQELPGTKLQPIGAAEEAPVVGAVGDDHDIRIEIQIMGECAGGKECAAYSKVAAIGIQCQAEPPGIRHIAGGCAVAMGNGVAEKQDLAIIAVRSQRCAVGKLQFPDADVHIAVVREQHGDPVFAFRKRKF